ncbi:SDR family NAD(P)-dependent oxidoreductase [Streptomyces sp. NPDC101132]|uniref:SDR family NAD(P)-dependent oxidoreductase n=1 Tax=Streptomyces sp. NPDC101132 TaxID=3366110 RepID=UPI00380D285C
MYDLPPGTPDRVILLAVGDGADGDHAGRLLRAMLAAEGRTLAVVAPTADRAARCARELAGPGRYVLPYAADPADREALPRALAEAARELGPPDVVIGTAVAAPEAGDEDPWHRVLDSGVTGSHRLATAAAGLMLGSARPGRIVLLAAAEPPGRRGGPLHPASRAAAAALAALVAGWAAQWPADRLTVNAVVPDGTAGPARTAAALRFLALAQPPGLTGQVLTVRGAAGRTAGAGGGAGTDGTRGAGRPRGAAGTRRSRGTDGPDLTGLAGSRAGG